MTDTLPVSPLSVSQEQYDKIRQSEAVVVSNYRGESGRFSKLAFIGTVEECEANLSTPSLFIVPNCIEYLGSEVVRTAELLPPENCSE